MQLKHDNDRLIHFLCSRDICAQEEYDEKGKSFVVNVITKQELHHVRHELHVGCSININLTARL